MTEPPHLTEKLTGQRLALLAAAGSFGLLAGAFVFQALGYAPCKMCLWQRWPHAAAIVLGLVIALVPNRVLMAFGALAAFTTGAFGVFHAGVEQKWWEGPSDCTGGGLGNLSGTDLLSTDVSDKLIMCDEIAWMFLSLSMPAWNALISFAFCALWVMALRHPRMTAR